MGNDATCTNCGADTIADPGGFAPSSLDPLVDPGVFIPARNFCPTCSHWEYADELFPSMAGDTK